MIVKSVRPEPGSNRRNPGVCLLRKIEARRFGPGGPFEAQGKQAPPLQRKRGITKRKGAECWPEGRRLHGDAFAVGSP
jgi:hypothetical protein